MLTSGGNDVRDRSIMVMQPKLLVITDRTDLPVIGLQMLVLSGTEISVREYDAAHDTIYVAGLEDYDLILINLYDRPSASVGICQQLRAQYMKPILVLIHEKDEDLLLRAYEAGADDCLLQPMRGRLLLALVRSWLRRAISS